MNEVGQIGYEGRSVEEITSLLRLRRQDVLVDVRLNAISRKKGFSKKALQLALIESGIRYLHMPELGNHRDNRAGYSEIGSDLAHQARSTFRDSLSNEASLAALDAILELSKTNRVTLFCFEHDEAHCHRQQIIEALHHRTETLQTV